jgi:hypothetical protein
MSWQKASGPAQSQVRTRAGARLATVISALVSVVILVQSRRSATAARRLFLPQAEALSEIAPLTVVRHSS